MVGSLIIPGKWPPRLTWRYTFPGTFCRHVGRGYHTEEVIPGITREPKYTHKQGVIKMRKLTVGIAVALILLYSLVTFSQTNSIKIEIELDTIKEYVLITNEGESSVNLKGWILHDHDYGKGQVYSYTFQDIQLKQGDVLQMQSGKTDKEEKEDDYKLSDITFYVRWSNRNVWNNKCDIAYLLDNNGELIAETHKGTEITKEHKDSCR